MSNRARPVLFLIIVLSLSWLAPPKATAQETLPVQIKADLFRYDRRTRVLTASGHVLLVFQDVRIRADTLAADLGTGEVTAEGNVLLEAGGQSIAAEVLHYNLTTRFGTLANAYTDYTGPLVLGAVHLRARRLEGFPGETATIRDGFLTTCEGPDPVVSLTAEEVTVYLNDRLVGRRVSLWLAGKKVFTWPYFQIFLRERRQSRLVPVVGYSEAEGVFIKTTYAYVVNERHYGFLYGDWMERLGIGTGIEHIYQADSGQGSLLLYRLANSQTSGTDLHAVLNHTQRFGPDLSGWFYADYFELRSPGAVTSSLFGALDLMRTTPGSTTYLFATGFTVSPEETSFLRAQLAHAQSLGPALFAQASLDLSRAISVAGTDDEAFPRLVLSYYGPRFSAGLVAETRWDLDGARFPLDDRPSLERLPELTVSLQPTRIGETLLLAQVQGGVGRFREASGSGGGTLDALRADATWTVSGPIPLGDGALGLRAFGRGDWYSTGETRLFYGGRLDYTRGLGSGVGVRLGYTGQGVFGASPFMFDDILTTFSFADAELFYQGGNVAAQASTYYDLQTQQWGSALAQVVFAPRPGWLVGTAASYSLQTGRLDRVELALDLQVSKDWQVQYLGAYDGLTGRVVHDRVAITRIFCDCLAVSLSYYGARGEIWLEGWLTALPWARGQIGVGQRGSFLFSLPSAPVP